MWYNVDFRKLPLLLLPIFLRKRLTIIFLDSYLTPLKKTHQAWNLFRNDNIYKIKHNGQVCNFRKALNDRFDPSLRRIYIDDGNRFQRKYLYTTAENKSNYLGKMFLHLNSDYADTGVDFVVFVPIEIINQQPFELKALIDFYKTGGKRYKIERI